MCSIYAIAIYIYLSILGEKYFESFCSVHAVWKNGIRKKMWEKLFVAYMRSTHGIAIYIYVLKFFCSVHTVREGKKNSLKNHTKKATKKEKKAKNTKKTKKR